jgi:hypothetical protein
MPDEVAAQIPQEKALPGKGVFGWLGRQFGYVSKAVAHDPAGPKTVYRVRSVEEKPVPDDPAMRLRRTTIDEVIMEINPKPEARNLNQ